MKSAWKYWIPSILLALVFFALPFEYKYDKVFRFYSLSLIPEGLILPKSFDKKIYFYPSDLIAATLFLIGLWTVRGRLFERGVSFLLLVFLGAILSIAASAFVHYPLAYIRLWQLFTPMALYAFLANGPLEKKTLMKIGTWGLFGSAMLQALIAIPQYFLQHSLGLRWLSEQRLDGKIPSVPSGKLSIFDGGVHSFEGIYRSIGTFPHPNVLGGFCALTLLVTLYLFFSYKKGRIWLAVAYFFQLLTLATTFSRSALYTWVFSTLFFLIWAKRKEKLSLRAPLLVILITTGIVSALFYEQYLYRGGIVSYTECNKGSDGDRLHYQRVALRMADRKPWLGVGYGRFSLDSTPFFDLHSNPKLAEGGVHNIYLRILAEMGIVTLAPFLCWILLILWAALRASASLEVGCLLAALLGILFIGGCDHYPILFQQGRLMLFGVAGLLARFGNFERKTSQQTLHIYD